LWQLGSLRNKTSIASALVLGLGGSDLITNMTKKINENYIKSFEKADYLIYLCTMKECEKRKYFPNLFFTVLTHPSSDHDGCFNSPAVHVLLKAGGIVERASNTLVTRGA
jgi:hypothetical protein